MKGLDILIPTYNRSIDLVYNLSIIEDIVVKGEWNDRVSIIVSNNCSTDTTDSDVRKFINKSSLNIIYYVQKSNIGLENNALFCLEKADADYVMYLGDDDYLNFEYFKKVMNGIDEIDNLGCILPSRIGITPSKELLSPMNRGIDYKSKLYEPGVKSSIENAHRGHQLSGVVLLRNGLYEAYRDKGVSNIYPFIFMVAYTALKGRLLHITEYPLKITQPGQDKKDWGYKDDGLISEIFDNYKKLGVTAMQRAQYEIKMIMMQPFRYNMYIKQGPIAAIRAVWLIIFGINTSSIGSIYISLYFVYYYSRKFVGKLLKIIGLK